MQSYSPISIYSFAGDSRAQSAGRRALGNRRGPGMLRRSIPEVDQLLGQRQG